MAKILVDPQANKSIECDLFTVDGRCRHDVVISSCRRVGPSYSLDIIDES